MKFLFTLFLCFASIFHVHAQSLSLFDIDKSNSPTIKAKFYAFDAAGNQMRPSASELSLTENGQPRVISSVTCPPSAPLIAISSVLTVDVSGSMSGGSGGTLNIDLAKAAAKVWIQGLPAGLSECALSSYNDVSYLNQDFTTDRSRLLNALTTLSPSGGTNYNMGLLQPLAGSLQVSQRGQHKRVVVFLTDGLPISEVNTNAMIYQAKQQNCMVFAVTLGMSCPQTFKDIAVFTGGEFYENVTTISEVENVYRRILNVVLGNAPCEIAWTNDVVCQDAYIPVQLTWQSNTASSGYTPFRGKISSLKVTPNFVAFKNRLPSTYYDTTITLTALNGNFSVTGINRKFGSAEFSVINSAFPFFIPRNTSMALTLRFAPSDSGMQYASFEIVTDRCPGSFSASGGSSETKIKSPTLKLITPNGGESYAVGSDTVITWEGVGKSDTVSLDYSIDSGNTWKSIVARASTLQYNWKNIPKVASNRCKIRVKQLSSEGIRTLGDLQITLSGHTMQVSTVAWSPNGTKVLTASWDGSAIIWDASTGLRLLTLNDHSYNAWVNSVSWSPDGSKVAIGASDYICRIWDAESGTKLMTVGHPAIFSVAWSPDGTKLATGGGDNTCVIWDVASRTKLLTLQGEWWVTSIAWSPDGTKIATACQNKVCLIWDAISGNKFVTLIEHTSFVTSVSWSPDGTKVATGSGDSTCIIWDVREATRGARLLNLRGHTGAVTSVGWSPDGTTVASGSRDSTCIFWDALSGVQNLKLSGHTGGVTSIAWSPDGTKMITGSSDTTGIIWNAKSGTKRLTLSGHILNITSVAWSQDGTKVATGSRDNTCIIWNALTGAKLLTIKGHTWDITSVSWSPDGTKVVSGSRDSTCIIWDAVSGTMLLMISGHTSAVTSVAWSPDGTKVVTGSADSTAIIWNASTGAKLVTLKGHSGGVTSVSWNPSGTQLTSGSRDSTCIIWDAISGAKILVLKGHKDFIASVSWNQDGTRIATGSEDNSCIIWDAMSGVKLLTLPEIAPVKSVSWSPDGSKVASGSWYNTCTIWDVSSGSELLTVKDHLRDVVSVSWSSDGSKIVTGSWDNTAKIWFVYAPTLQEDQSDNTFSIVEPLIKASDIDMQKCLLGSSKDSVVQAFVGNVGTSKCHIDSIYITGYDAEAFAVVSGLEQYNLAAGDSKQAEFRFSPYRVGVHTAELNIVTQSDILRQPIRGEGIAPTLKVVNSVLDFGKVRIGTSKDTLLFVTLVNIGTSPLTITNTRHAGPNDVDFTTLAGGGAFMLAPGDTSLIDLRFLPSTIGRTTGQLLFEYNGVGSPALIQLFGEGIEPTGIHEKEENEKILDLEVNQLSLSTQPNPINNRVQIHYSIPKPQTVTIELLNMTGQVAQTILNNQSQLSGQYTLTSDLSMLGNGVYLLRLRTNKEMLTTRVDVVK